MKAYDAKTHRERGQLKSRAKLGLLEKKKDYKLRAEDYHNKQKRLTLMKQKAAFRNPDEFYFKMQNSQLRKGVHRDHREGPCYSADVLQLMRTQDVGYVKYQLSLNQKKLEAHPQALLQEVTSNTHVVFQEDEKKGIRPVKVPVQPLEPVNDPDIEKQQSKFQKEIASRLERTQKLRQAEQAMELQKVLMTKGPRKKIGQTDDGRPIYKWKAVRKR
jgi:U3 small nucleolar RNA-associated protein 11